MLRPLAAAQSVGRGGDTLLVGALAWLVMVAVANTGATAVAQPALRAAFGVGPAAVGWVVFGYTAAFAISTAWYGSLAARFSAGRTIAAGASVLGIGALTASVAGAFPMVVAARVAQGLGAGAIPTLAFAIASERFDGGARDRAIGYIVAGVGAGQALGPLLGGALIDSVSWRGSTAAPVTRRCGSTCAGPPCSPSWWVVRRSC
jgi:MFS family permease